MHFQNSKTPQRKASRFIQISQGERVLVHVKGTFTTYPKCIPCYHYPGIHVSSISV